MEARATFCNLEPVLVQLVHVSVRQVLLEAFRPPSPCLLCFCVSDGEPARHGDPEGDEGEPLPENRRLRQGEQNSCRSLFVSRKCLTASVPQACAAYSFITIPSLSSIFTRLNLYLLSGQVALANQCLSQGELLLAPSRSSSLIFCLDFTVSSTSSFPCSSVFSVYFCLFHDLSYFPYSYVYSVSFHLFHVLPSFPFPFVFVMSSLFSSTLSFPVPSMFSVSFRLFLFFLSCLLCFLPSCLLRLLPSRLPFVPLFFSGSSFCLILRYL